jgi:solute carrier family 13 (sodium-dependent dicarboxylate transporter), member 2/3/5
MNRIKKTKKLNLLLKKIIIALGIIMFISLQFIIPPSGLTVEGAKSLGVFSLCIALWVTGAIPLAITSLLGMALIPLLGIMDSAEAFSIFGNRAVFFILGALMLAAALYKTGLGTRIAYYLLMRFNKKPRSIVLGIMLSAALLSCIMPEHAVAAMLFPIVLEIADSMNLKPFKSSFGKGLFIALAWGAIIGGITTYLGGARNLLAVSLLEKNYGITIGFFEWIGFVLPIPIIILTIAYLVLIKFFKPEMSSAEDAYQSLSSKVESMGPISTKELKLSVVLVLVIGAWLFFSVAIHISVTAILGGVAIFILKVIDWKDMVDYINWGVILMYGGAIVVATSITTTGATAWLAGQLLTHVSLSPVLFIVLIIILTVFITEGISNVAAVAIMIPLAFSVGDILNLNPVAVTLLVALPGGLAFCLPMGTPPNAIAFSSGYYSIGEVLRPGIILNIISIVVILIVALFYWPLVNLSLFM